MIYVEDFQSWEDVEQCFNMKEDNAIPLYAEYTYENYDGSAFVLYVDRRDMQLYAVYGGHCSCYGLEDQWDPEHIPWNVSAEMVGKTASLGGYEQVVLDMINSIVGSGSEEDIMQGLTVFKLKHSV
jgi:hypothetical protein